MNRSPPFDEWVVHLLDPTPWSSCRFLQRSSSAHREKMQQMRPLLKNPAVVIDIDHGSLQNITIWHNPPGATIKEVHLLCETNKRIYIEGNTIFDVMKNVQLSNVTSVFHSGVWWYQGIHQIPSTHQSGTALHWPSTQIGTAQSPDPTPSRTRPCLRLPIDARLCWGTHNARSRHGPAAIQQFNLFLVKTVLKTTLSRSVINNYRVIIMSNNNLWSIIVLVSPGADTQLVTKNEQSRRIANYTESGGSVMRLDLAIISNKKWRRHLSAHKSPMMCGFHVWNHNILIINHKKINHLLPCMIMLYYVIHAYDPLLERKASCMETIPTFILTFMIVVSLGHPPWWSRLKAILVGTQPSRPAASQYLALEKKGDISSINVVVSIASGSDSKDV